MDLSASKKQKLSEPTAVAVVSQKTPEAGVRAADAGFDAAEAAFDAADAGFDAGFDAAEAGFDAADAGFDAAEAGFDAGFHTAEAGFDAADAGFDAADAAEAGFDAADAGFDAAEAGFDAAEAGFDAADAGFDAADAAEAGFDAADAGFDAAEAGFDAADAGFHTAEAGFDAADAGFDAADAGFDAAEAGLDVIILPSDGDAVPRLASQETNSSMPTRVEESGNPDSTNYTSDDAEVDPLVNSPAESLKTAPNHSADLLNLKCDLCEESFTNAQNFKTHRRSHDAEVNFACTLCDKSFASSDSLRKHRAVHVKPSNSFVSGTEGEVRLGEVEDDLHASLSYPCDFCPAAFSRLGSLTRHELLHTKEKPFVCDKCPNVKFRQNHDLKMHKKTVHEGIFPHHCTLCPAKFAYKTRLTSHEKIHSRPNLLACEQCGWMFANSNHRDQHVIKFHSEQIVTATTSGDSVSQD